MSEEELTVFRYRGYGDPGITRSNAWPGGQPSGEDAGFNGILARTNTGLELLEAVVSADQLLTDKPLSPRDVDHVQPHQVRKKQAVWTRIECLRQAGQRVPDVSGLRLELLAQRNSTAQNEREIAHTRRRLLEGQSKEPTARAD